ncbi:hypothetical protein OG352_11305 [Streptomyces sp. NBC_01485]|uniref:hypothetical protein n=1 Tax=Streptomyces sp. NBC_01485 TaxID=2903884 RepID=UPI002E33D533|nr:hypothetical protein [Streptomyces sp. NBC_01485]
MAEHDSDREDRENRDEREGRDGLDGPDARTGREPEEQSVPFDEAAAWAAIVAGYGEEPVDPPGAKPFKSVEDLALLEVGTNGEESGADSVAESGAESGKEPEKDPDEEKKPAKPLGSSIAFAPGVGPRDYAAPEPVEEDFDEDDEGHFVPPEPPPLPAADTTAKFAWLGVIGGPVLLLLAVLLGWEMTWWLSTVCIGGFLGGFATLVARMRPDDEDEEGPGRGAVV